MANISHTRSRVALAHRSGVSLIDWIIKANAVWRSRRQLEDLNMSQLEDIGLDRKSAQNEASRPIWDVPAHWLR